MLVLANVHRFWQCEVKLNTAALCCNRRTPPEHHFCISEICFGVNCLTIHTGQAALTLKTQNARVKRQTQVHITDMQYRSEHSLFACREIRTLVLILAQKEGVRKFWWYQICGAFGYKTTTQNAGLKTWESGFAIDALLFVVHHTNSANQV